jgi:hypothetical protein
MQVWNAARSWRARLFVLVAVVALVGAGLPHLTGRASSAPGSPVVAVVSAPGHDGVWIAREDGSVVGVGDVPSFGSLEGTPLRLPITGMAATPTGGGYWLVARDGGVFAFGDAGFHGSTGSMRLNAPVVGMASTPSGRGYWLVARDGGIFTFGDAGFHGSMGGVSLNAPIVAMAASASGDGYRLVAEDGGVFALGDATFHGSTGAMRLSAPVTGIAATASGAGYRLVARDGGVFTFGDAAFLGTRRGGDQVVDIATTSDGYAIVDVRAGLSQLSPAGIVETAGDAVPVSAAGSTAGGRDRAMWPFASDSPWNVPVGSGARFAGEADAITRDVRVGGAGINAGNWSHPVYEASASDPVWQVYDRSGGDPSTLAWSSQRLVGTIHAPSGISPAGNPGVGDVWFDRHLHVVQPDGDTVQELYATYVDQGARRISVTHSARFSLSGSGLGTPSTRASGVAAIGGLIRTWELQAGQISHALAVAIDNDQMRPGPVWPAALEDGHAATEYHGAVPMGTLMAIPPSVDLNSLGLSPGGLVLARALQDHGAYLVDGSSGFVFYAEPGAEGMAQLAQMRADASRLQELLRPITNNAPTSVSGGGVGGGGTPRATLAPALAAP